MTDPTPNDLPEGAEDLGMHHHVTFAGKAGDGWLGGVGWTDGPRRIIALPAVAEPELEPLIDFEFGDDLCRFLGLDPRSTRKVTVTAGVDEVPVVHVEGYVTKPDGERVLSAGHWKLTPPTSPPQPQEG